MSRTSTSQALEKLAKSDSDHQREALLIANPALGEPRTVKTLYDRVSLYLRQDLSRADSTARTCLWLSRRLGHVPSIALSLRGLGNVELLRDQPKSALRRFYKALRLFNEANSLPQAAQTQLNILAAHLSLGDYGAAHKVATLARDQLAQLDDPLSLARLDNNLGTLLFRQERFAEARKYWRKALKAFNELGHRQDAAIALRNLAVCEISLNNFREALRIYHKVSHYCKANNLTLLLHEVEYNIAYLYFLRGDHDRALDGYRLARERSLKLGDPFHAALCDLDEAELYLELNLLPDAISLARRASGAFKKLSKSYEAAKALSFEAIAKSRLGDDHRALELLRTAHRSFLSHGHLAWASLSLLYEALILFKEGRRFESLRAALTALEGFTRLDTSEKSALCHLLLGRLHLESEQLALARKAVSAAMTLTTDRGIPHVAYQAHLLLGDIDELSGDLHAAKASYYESVRLLQSLRTHVSASDLHIPFPESRLAAYDRLLQVESLVQSPQDLPAIALKLVEQERARTISDLLGTRALRIPPNSPARSGLVEQVRGLREELRWHYKKISQQEMALESGTDSRSDPSFHEIEEKILKSLGELAKEDPEFGHLNQAFTIDLEHVQGLLAPDEVLLEYFVGADVVTVVLLSRTLNVCKPVAITSEIDELRRLLDYQASRVVPTHESFKRNSKSAELAKRCLAELYIELVSPIAEHLEGFRRLKIVPHSFLAYLPFHALVIEGESGLDLGDQFRVSYSPSVASLDIGRRRKRSAQLMAALVFEADSELGNPESPLLNPPWSGEFLPLETPRAMWRERLREGWGVVQMPLQVNYRLDNPVLSDVVISGCEMTILDLFQIKLNADVAVFMDSGPAATSMGNGDELVCLTRSLLYSGPNAILIPLRRGRRAPLEHLIRVFYEGLGTGQTADRALQRAERSCKAEYPHMADWAQLAIYGL